MSKSLDPNGELRAAFTPRLLKRARATAHGGLPGMVVRIALGTLFLALVVVSHELMGTTGVAFVGALFVILVFLPILIQVFRKSGQEDVIQSDVAGEGVEPDVASEDVKPGVTGKGLVAESASEG